MDAGAKSPQGVAIGDVMYTVKVTTDAGKKSGTDANVSIQMTGANGSSGVYVLAKKNAVNKKQNLFESGQTDDFELGPIAKLGKISKIHLASDGHKGLTHVFSTDWVCESIEIVEGDGTSSFTFNCDQKFSKKEGMAHHFNMTEVGHVTEANREEAERAGAAALAKAAKVDRMSELERLVSDADDSDSDSESDGAKKTTDGAAAGKNNKGGATSRPPHQAHHIKRAAGLSGGP